ncbi:MAG: 3-phosphoshikimate 1-carboxyvinyltransferase [Melioribacteraceae bacterium]|nr:3-phosphoshikimate 1-carboxyvinyltransferase [Melioribacteraceae bacterium]
MNQYFDKINSLKGELFLAGDKSISHRAVMFASLADGKSIIHNCSESEDVYSTIKCFQELGCQFNKNGNSILISGKGFKNFNQPKNFLDAGNSGTTTRLISGILSAQNFTSVIIGDESLSKRPMMRIVEPLNLMGANIEASENGTLPLKIFPSKELKSIEYKLKVASAQVKSALLLLALHLEIESVIIDPFNTRNHTEKMLNLKVEDTIDGKKIICSRKNYPEPFEMTIPSDISSASFFIVAALISKNSEILIKNVSLNPTRTGIIDILRQMGGKIELMNQRKEFGEEVGDIFVQSSELKNIEISKEIIPNIIDEIPILSIAGIFAEGNFEINHAEELRVKESDRIKSICSNLLKVGLDVIENKDGFMIKGNIKNNFAEFESFGDHRIAMAFAVLSMMLEKGGRVNEFDCVKISNPNFLEQIKSLHI